MLPGSYAPLLAAFLVHRLHHGNWRAVDFLRGCKRAWVGIVIGPILALTAIVIIPSLFIATSAVRDLNWEVFSYYYALVFHWRSITGGPLGEEPGWRGYALPPLQAKYGAVVASLIVGVLLALWHLPLFLVDGWTSSPVGVYVLILSSLSVLMTFSFNVGGGSVAAAIIAHSAANSCSHMLRGVLKGAETRENPSGDLITGLSLAAVAAVLGIATRGRLGQASSPSKA
jgi:membrane protease YdiL (CAAX protease family)